MFEPQQRGADKERAIIKDINPGIVLEDTKTDGEDQNFRLLFRNREIRFFTKDDDRHKPGHHLKIPPSAQFFPCLTRFL